MEPGSPDLLGELLKSVSRSFYLTLRVLPSVVRPQIGLAYLLARATDTVADTNAIPKDQRLGVLDRLRDRICGSKGEALSLEVLASRQNDTAEQVLLRRLPKAFELLERLEAPDRERIRDVLRIIISGQALDLERFGEADASHIVTLRSEVELDDYTYRVAGCVGEFWTKICRAHVFPRDRLDDGFLLANGVRFGKGLQLVNVLRDLPADLRQGRCYLPEPALAEVGLIPLDLLRIESEEHLRPRYQRYLDLAEAHLQAGWAYTNHLPFRCMRVRLACAWPILIGVQTVARLRSGHFLDPSRRIKVSRREVRQVLVGSAVAYPWPGRWQKLFERFRCADRNQLPDAASLAK
jgi:farnesyl-diphosphate farnesyltransferase